MDRVTVKFGTDGVRGIVGESITDLVVAVIAEATLRYWGRRHGVSRVLVSHDTRRMSRDFAVIIASVAREHGVDANIVSSPTPTPVVSWAVLKYRYDLAFQVTASHNPPMYNGVKVIGGDGAPAKPEDTNGIEEVINSEYDDVLRSVRDIEYTQIPSINVRDGYVEYLVSWFSSRFKPRKLKVLVDPIHGAAVGYTASILKGLGFDAVEVNSEQDPDFKGKLPNPEYDQIKDDIDAVLSGKYDMAIAHDGDSDRVAMVVKGLGYLDANRIIPVFLRALWGMGMVKRGVARTVATTHLIDDIALDLNIKVTETPVGIKYIVDAINRGEADIGGEESGGLAYSWHIPEKDGIYSGVMGACIEGTGGVSSIYGELTSRYGERHFRRIDIKANDAKTLVNRIKPELRRQLTSMGELTGFVEIDGFKAVYRDKSWVLIRGSGTEPLIRIYSEALSMSRVNELLGSVVDLVNRLVKG
ncbi:phosphoglucomutase/phosphomannomutase family protein [Caldivirga maquilingensis]|uniref:phosphoglucomutase/phosphomannomutase family protein n=1 Tax=Caldivirga maquilingensis TaxID=76887 RepID=UPI000AB433E4|nr:phosphoglucomutase/phosphomannomutase family protein [Caldivirga maquilingensis]